jgi:hypothetical protein
VDAVALAPVAMPNGHILLSGFSEEGIDLGGGPLTSTGLFDVFLAELDGNGNHQWSESFPSAGWGAASYGVGTDAAGNIYLSGIFTDTVDFGGGPLTSAGNYDQFLVKLDANGNHVWSKRFGDAGQTTPMALATLAVDAAGNIYLLSNLQDSADFGSGPVTSVGATDIVVARFDTNGNIVWLQQFGSVGSEYMWIRLGPTGTLWLSGFFSGPMNVGNFALPHAGVSDGAVAELDTSGTVLWADSFGSAVGDTCTAMPTALGHVVIAGTFANTVSIAGNTFVANGDWDCFVLELDASHASVWSATFGATGETSCLSLAGDAAGHTIVGIGYKDTMLIGSQLLTSTDEYDSAIVALDGAGSPINWRSFSGLGSQLVFPFGDVAGGTLFGGEFHTTVDFGTGPLTSAGSFDIVLGVLAPVPP